MRVNATIGANGEYYAKNTHFNYIGAQSAVSLDLSPLMNRLWNGMTLTVLDRFIYTPQPPSFLVGNQEGATLDPFVLGQQVGRVNTMSNFVSALVRAPLTQTLNLTGGYSYGLLRFGTSEVPQAGALLDSTYQTGTVGISKDLSYQDIVSLSLFNSEYRYEGDGGSFSTRGGFIGWEHLFNPNVRLTSSAGVTVLQRQSSEPSNGRTTVAPLGRVALIWADNTTTLSMAYRLGIAPSFQFEAQPLLSNMVTFSVTQTTPIPELVGVASVNYGRGDEIGPSSVSAVSYESYMATGGVLYKFTPQTFLNLMYLYGNYDNQFGVTSNSFDRQVVSISLAQAFY
jgi:hypothetical protein